MLAIVGLRNRLRMDGVGETGLTGVYDNVAMCPAGDAWRLAAPCVRRRCRTDGCGDWCTGVAGVEVAKAVRARRNLGACGPGDVWEDSDVRRTGVPVGVGEPDRDADRGSESKSTDGWSTV